MLYLLGFKHVRSATVMPSSENKGKKNTQLICMQIMISFSMGEKKKLQFFSGRFASIEQQQTNSIITPDLAYDSSYFMLIGKKKITPLPSTNAVQIDDNNKCCCRLSIN